MRKILTRVAFAAAVFVGTFATAEAATSVEVWKSPYCGCCGGWIDHMKAAGFDVTTHNIEDLEPIKAANGVKDAYASCHTAVVDGYVIEGHVPADDVRRLLAERPAVKGLAAPGMPEGSPGMGAKGAPYEVLSFDANGKTEVYARH